MADTRISRALSTWIPEIDSGLWHQKDKHQRLYCLADKNIANYGNTLHLYRQVTYVIKNFKQTAPKVFKIRTNF